MNEALQRVIQRNDTWQKTVKPQTPGTDEWTHFLHGADNNGVSLDDVGPPQRLRWHDTPEYGRSKALSPSFTNMVSADGVLMTIEDRATTEDVNALSEYYLVARDAYNGIELWKRPMKEEWIGWQGGSIKSISTQQQRCLAAIGKTVYVCPGFGGPVTALDSRTGEQKQVFKLTEQTAEFLIEGNILYGIKGAPYRVGKSNLAGGVELYALDLDKATMIWSKHIANEYTGGTFAVNGGRAAETLQWPRGTEVTWDSEGSVGTDDNNRSVAARWFAVPSWVEMCILSSGRLSRARARPPRSETTSASLSGQLAAALSSTPLIVRPMRGGPPPPCA